MVTGDQLGPDSSSTPRSARCLWRYHLAIELRGRAVTAILVADSYGNAEPADRQAAADVQVMRSFPQIPLGMMEANDALFPPA